MEPDASYADPGRALECPTPHKNRYSSRRVAKATLGGGNRKHYRVYLCRCGSWHHTHKTSRRAW